MLTPDTWNQIDGPLRVPPPEMNWRDFRSLLDGLRSIDTQTVLDAGIIPDRAVDRLRFRSHPERSYLGLDDDKAARLFDILVREVL